MDEKTTMGEQHNTKLVVNSRDEFCVVVREHRPGFGKALLDASTADVDGFDRPELSCDTLTRNHRALPMYFTTMRDNANRRVHLDIKNNSVASMVAVNMSMPEEAAWICEMFNELCTSRTVPDRRLIISLPQRIPGEPIHVAARRDYPSERLFNELREFDDYSHNEGDNLQVIPSKELWMSMVASTAGAFAEHHGASSVEILRTDTIEGREMAMRRSVAPNSFDGPFECYAMKAYKEWRARRPKSPIHRFYIEELDVGVVLSRLAIIVANCAPSHVVELQEAPILRHNAAVCIAAQRIASPPTFRRDFLNNSSNTGALDQFLTNIGRQWRAAAPNQRTELPNLGKLPHVKHILRPGYSRSPPSVYEALGALIALGVVETPRSPAVNLNIAGIPVDVVSESVDAAISSLYGVNALSRECECFLYAAFSTHGSSPTYSDNGMGLTVREAIPIGCISLQTYLSSTSQDDAPLRLACAAILWASKTKGLHMPNFDQIAVGPRMVKPITVILPIHDGGNEVPKCYRVVTRNMIYFTNYSGMLLSGERVDDQVKTLLAASPTTKKPTVETLNISDISSVYKDYTPAELHLAKLWGGATPTAAIRRYLTRVYYTRTPWSDATSDNRNLQKQRNELLSVASLISKLGGVKDINNERASEFVQVIDKIVH